MDYLGQKVVVTTDKRGVFFGTLNEREGTSATLSDVRNCVYWDSSVKGFLGLAVNGPSGRCRIGPAAPSIELAGVTAIIGCTKDAIVNWEKAPWCK